MEYLKLYLILLICLLNNFNCSTETKEKELFEVHTPRDTYVQFNISENSNKYNYLFIQVILCEFLSSGNHLSLVNELGEEIFSTDFISSRNFFVNITEQVNNTSIINATSNDMYIQYQYVNDSKNIILASGRIRDYIFEENYISFNLTPVVSNKETTYDLYYLGKTNIYNDICQKVAFVLENEPISTLTFKGEDYFDLKFENIPHKTGYYLIKGNNVDNISYYYFYERINIVNRLGPFKTNSVEFFEVKSESDEYYSIFTTPGNINNNNYLNLQIILCEHYGDQKSHISLLDENNVEIFFTDIIVSRQLSLDIYSTNITIMATSPHMYIQYQFTDYYYHVIPLGIIYSHESNVDYHYLNFNVTPVAIDTSSYYELFFEKNKSLIPNDCAKLVYSLNNKPISTLNVFGNLYTDLNFTYDLIGEGQNEDGYVFIKSKNINDTNYTYFFETVNATINYKKNKENDEDDNDDNSTVLMAVIYSVIGLVIVALVIVLIILYKSGKCSRKKEEENPNSISILNRDSDIK